MEMQEINITGYNVYIKKKDERSKIQFSMGSFGLGRGHHVWQHRKVQCIKAQRWAEGGVSFPMRLQREPVWIIWNNPLNISGYDLMLPLFSPTSAC